MEVRDLPLIFMVAFAGFILGGVVSYLANLLLYREKLVSYPPTGKFCTHRGKITDAIPFLPFILISKSCLYCQRRVRWQYLIAEILLAMAFVLLVRQFGFKPYSYGMLLYVTILLCIAITDFRTKIIPHEITYPAIIAGIVFSALTNANVQGALTGIGISYILFDFLAFYGLQFYTWIHKPELAPNQQFISAGKQLPLERRRFAKKRSWISAEAFIFHSPVVKRAVSMLYCRGTPIEELEVIGGGDAVLSALIAAWLGWQKLIIALVAGFLVGAVMGSLYILNELKTQRMLKALIVPVSSCVSLLSGLSFFMLWMLATSLNQNPLDMPYLYILPVAASTGILLGIVVAGSRISKPFPFGPALALGGFIAIFSKSSLMSDG